MAKVQLFSPKEFAASLGCTVAGVRRWVLTRRITYVKIGRLVRIPETELDRIIREGLRPAREVRHG